MSRPDVPAAPTANLDLLVVLAVIARERSFTRAAAVLGISQPSISARVRRLEQRVGEPVFERLGRGVRLTPTGETLRAAADRALALAQDADQLWHGLGAQSRGYVRLAASTTIAGYVLPAALAAFRRTHPDIEIEVRVGNTAQVAALIGDGELSWGLVEGPVDATHLVSRTFLEDELILIVPPRHPWTRRRAIRARDLEGTPFIARESGSGTAAIHEAVLAGHGVRLRPVLRIADSRGIVAAVAAGAGVAIVSSLVARPFVASRQVVRVAIQGVTMTRALSAIHRPGRSLVHLDRALLQAISGPLRS
ncbi:MAG: LysR family transcriptional regulator [Gemmatimonadaceae bacterium]